MNTKDQLFKCAEEAYNYLNSHDTVGLPSSFSLLSQSQQDFFIDFFDFCREVEYDQKEEEDKLEDFLCEVKERLGSVGEEAVENLLYEKGLKVVSED